MAAAFTLAVLSASFLIALGFALKRKQWLMGWFLGSLVPAVVFPVVDFFRPTEWLGVAIFFGTLYCIVASSLGLLIAWLMVRAKRRAQAPAREADGRSLGHNDG